VQLERKARQDLVEIRDLEEIKDVAEIKVPEVVKDLLARK